MSAFKTNRFVTYALNHTWAWYVMRFVYVPIAATVYLVRQHIPEFVGEVRAEWREAEALRVKYLANKASEGA